MARIKQLWTGTVIVHGRPRHPQDQGSVERANGDFKNMLYARLRDVKELNQWVGELPYVQYSKNNAYHSGIRTTPYRVHFGKAPADLSVDMTLPKEVVERLETEDDLCGVLESRQVIGYASFDPSSDTPIASPNPLPFSHLSLQESASGAEVGGPVSSLPISLPVVAINSSFPLMSLMYSYPLGLRPGRRSGQPVPELL